MTSTIKNLELEETAARTQLTSLYDSLKTRQCSAAERINARARSAIVDPINQNHVNAAAAVAAAAGGGNRPESSTQESAGIFVPLQFQPAKVINDISEYKSFTDSTSQGGGVEHEENPSPRSMLRTKLVIVGLATAGGLYAAHRAGKLPSLDTMKQVAGNFVQNAKDGAAKAVVTLGTLADASSKKSAAVMKVAKAAGMQVVKSIADELTGVIDAASSMGKKAVLVADKYLPTRDAISALAQSVQDGALNLHIHVARFAKVYFRPEMQRVSFN